MSKLILISIFMVCQGVSLFAQKGANVWYFGANAGLDFSSGTPVALTDGQLNTLEGCATIADASGNLLFYTDGMTVWNKNHQIMSNGSGLKGHSSSTQSAIIVPQPGSNSIYHVFTVDIGNQTNNGLNYSTVDMTLDGGLGAVTVKNTQLVMNTNEKVTAVVHENGRDIWVVTHTVNTNSFYAYLVNDSGVNTTPVISNSGATVSGSSLAGYMKASPDGLHLCVLNKNMGYAEAQLFDFDNKTGSIGNPITLFNSLMSGSGYGLEFSPSGRLLYIAQSHPVSGDIYQYDLNATDIPGSKAVVASTSGWLYAMQLGPDGKIYICKDKNTFLHAINKPDVNGVGCNFQENAVDLGGRLARLGLPTFIQSFFIVADFSFNHTCFGEATDFIVNIPVYDSLKWDFGDLASGVQNVSSSAAPTHYFSAKGNYTVRLIAFASGTSDTTEQQVVIEGPVADAGPDTSLFAGQSTELAASGGSTFKWHTGETQQTLQVTPAVTSTYTVTVTDTNNCYDTDEVVVTVTEQTDLSTTCFSEDFDDGDYTNNVMWSSENIDDKPGNTQIFNSGGSQYLRVWRAGALGNGGRVHLKHSPALPVNVNTAIQFDVNVIHRDVRYGDGDNNEEHPASVNLYLRDGSNNLLTLRFCYNYGGAGHDSTASNYIRIVTNNCSQGVWKRAEQYVIADYFPQAVLLESIRLGASGWNFEGQYDNIEVLCPIKATVLRINGDSLLCPGDQTTLTVTDQNGSYTWADQNDPGVAMGSDIPLLVAPTISTTYMAYDHSDTAYHVIVVKPIPTVNLSATYFVCEGDAITLSLSGQDSYMWNTGATNSSIQVSPVNSTTYTVTFSKSGCSNTDETVIHLLKTPVTVIGDTICQGDTAEMTAIGAGVFLWNTGQSASAITVMPAISTTYSVTITMTGCTESGTGVLVVYPTPVFTVNQDTSVCPGAHLTFNALGSNTYLWHTGETTQTIQAEATAGTTYIVTATNLYSCTATEDIALSILPVPSAIAGNDTAICMGSSVTVSPSGGSSYLWSDGSTGNMIAAPTITTIYSVTVTDDAGCTDSDDITLQVNPLPSISTTPNDTSVCPGVDLTITTSGGTSYLWHTGATSATIAVTATASVLYAVTATNQFNCSDTDMIVLTTLPAPNASAGKDTTVCMGSTVLLTTQEGANFLWSTGATVSQIAVSPTASSNYVVTVSLAGGCSDTDTVNVSVWSLPLAYAGKDTGVCSGEVAELRASGGIAFEWDDGTVDPFRLCATAGTYTVTVTDGNGCSGKEEVMLAVHPLPEVSMEMASTVCVTAENIVLSSGSPTGGVYSGPGVNNGVFDPSVAGTGMHLIAYTFSDIHKCTGRAEDTVVVVASPTLLLADTGFCDGGSLLLLAGKAEDSAYRWQDGTTGATRLIETGETGSYTVTVTLGENCTASATATIIEYPAPEVQIKAADQKGCVPYHVSVIDHATNDVGHWRWDFGDPIRNDNSITTTTPQAQHTYSAQGSFTVSVYVEDSHGCSNQVEFVDFFTVYDNPVAGLEWTPEKPSTSELSVTFNSQYNEGVKYWYWQFDDDLEASNQWTRLQQVFHTFPGEGTYEVLMMVRDNNGCVDSVSQPITVVKEQHIYMPTAFSPNADGHNDRFGPVGKDISEDGYGFYIFTRWGEEIFHARSVEDRWDGTHWGVPVPVNVYNWLLYYKNETGKIKKMKGLVSVLK